MAKMKRSVATAITAGVTAAALALGGTFAWQAISQQALNETVIDINPGARLHDDFNGLNKDVYVENFGDDATGVPVFARVRLDEYMEIGQDAGINKGDTGRVVTVLDKDDTDGITPDINDVNTWQTYIPGDSSVEHIFADNETVYTKYWNWILGNADTDADKIYYMPTFNKNKDSLAADINGTYEGKVPNNFVHYDDYVVYGPGKVMTETDTVVTDADSNTDEEDVGVKSADVAIDYSTTDLDQPIDNYNVYHEENVEHTATQLSSGAEVISMETFFADESAGGKGGEPGPYWVYDTDGWAYWAQPILPGETTGLLLNGINMSRVPDDNYYYGINVVGQFATESDLETAFDNPTAEAADLIYTLTHEPIIYALLTTTDGGTTHSLSIRDSYLSSPFTVGETYKGGTIVEVYEDIDNQGYGMYNPIPYTIDDASVTTDYADTITSASVDTKIAPVNTATWFVRLKNITEVKGLTNIDFSNVTTAEAMFGTNGIKVLDVSNWDLSSMLSLHGTFSDGSLEQIIGLETWDVSNVVSFRSLFNSAKNLQSVNLTGWDITNAGDISHMFARCNSLTSAGAIDQWDTSNATNIMNMFTDCPLAVDLTAWDVSGATVYTTFIYNSPNVIPPATWDTITNAPIVSTPTTPTT